MTTTTRDAGVPRPLPLGVDDYKKLVEGGYWSADKTLLIRDVVDAAPEVLLFCRPRRFGKTLNMSMLRYFFERPAGWPGPGAGEAGEAGSAEGAEPPTARLFRDKAIWSCGERYRRLQGRFPVVSVTLKDLHFDTFEGAREKFAELISVECARHPELADGAGCEAADREAYARLRARRPGGVDLEGSLALLTRMLHAQWGEQAVLVVDEYDALIQAGHERGYYDEAVNFTRNLLSPALKGNPHLKTGFLTGILRVAKESIFSGLNNVKVDTVLDRRYAQYFGLTKDEARALLEERGQLDRYLQLLEWYDGYRFGDQDMLNPWSALSYVDADCLPMAWWVDTSGNSIVGELLEEATPEIEEGLETLMQGGTVTASVNTAIVYPEIRRDPASLWSFLLVTGYLTARSATPVGGVNVCELAVPNREVTTVFANEVVGRLAARLGRRDFADRFALALFRQDAPALEAALRGLLLASASFYDTAGESFYHGMMLGLCAMAGGDYHLSSNREAGLGRFDLQLEPRRPERGLPGILIEVKAAGEGDDLGELASEVALGQVRERDYAAGMRARGTGRVASFGVAFRGKDARVAIEVAQGAPS